MDGTRCEKPLIVVFLLGTIGLEIKSTAMERQQKVLSTVNYIVKEFLGSVELLFRNYYHKNRVEMKMKIYYFLQWYSMLHNKLVITKLSFVIILI